MAIDLGSISLFCSEYLGVIVIAFTLLIIILLTSVIRLNGRMKKMLQGDKTSLEESINSVIDHVEMLEEFKKDSEEYLTLVEKRLRNSISGFETIRFNPFKGTGAGGNQSFASAFINEHGDGVVFSTLYASDRMSIFAKPIKKYKSEYELTDEEARAIAEAHDKLILPKS